MINSTERSDILVFNCYLCHVRFLLTYYVCSTKIGEISDISKCFENFVSQALRVLTRIYAAELRNYKAKTMEILGIVFWYKPELTSAIKSLESYIYDIKELIIWNNSTFEDLLEFDKILKPLPYYQKIKLMGEGKNKGLSYPINLAMNRVLHEKFDSLLTMDQDSIWVNFKEYTKIIETNKNYRASIFRPNFEQRISEHELEPTYGFLINSGTIYGKNAIIKNGKMQESFFVEGLDTEYGFRAYTHNIMIYTVIKGEIEHNVNDQEQVRFMGLSMHKCKYSPSRLFGITYSHTIMIREFPFRIRLSLIRSLMTTFGIKLLLSIILTDKDKTSRISSYFSGIIKGLTSKLPQICYFN